jgi:hypothetical protein
MHWNKMDGKMRITKIIKKSNINQFTEYKAGKQWDLANSFNTHFR